MNQAVFIDRDGTISEEVGYINHASRFRLFPYAATAIQQLHESGYLAVLVTNQAGVARGYFSEDMVQSIHKRMTEELETSGAKLDGIYYCAHHPPWVNHPIDSTATAASQNPDCCCARRAISTLT